MIAKVILGTMKNAKNLVSVAEKIPYDVELCCERYTVNAKSMLGVLSLPNFVEGELHVHTDEEDVCEKILNRLLELDLLKDSNDSVKRSLFDVTAFGEILIDFTAEGTNAFGQTLFAQNPGGAPANVLAAASSLGAKTAFLGKAGKDMHGEFLKQVLENKNIKTKGMILDNRYFTTLAFVDVNILGHTYIFHVGSLSLTDEPSRGTTFYAVKYAKDKGSIISYDPNYRASLWENEEVAKLHMRSLVPLVDLIKISDEEMELLTDEREMEKAAEVLAQQGVKIVVITLGKDGAYLYAGGKGVLVKGFESQVKDTNGAGDSFWGGFLYQLSQCQKPLQQLEREELEDYVRFGNAVASLCVEGKGAIPAMPDLTQVTERLGGR